MSKALSIFQTLALSRLARRVFPPAVPPEAIAPVDTLEVPGYRDGEGTGIFINPYRVIALGVQEPKQGGILVAGDPPDEPTLTILYDNSNEFSIRLDTIRAMAFARDIYNACPDKFVPALPDLPVLQTSKSSRYLIAKGQSIHGKVKYDDCMQVWGLDLSFGTPGKLRVNLAGFRHMSHSADWQKFADELATFSDEVFIDRGLRWYKGNPRNVRTSYKSLEAKF
ncbi:MAG: hypothetical protein AAF988_04155 [Pseudomonadota bacterium]